MLHTRGGRSPTHIKHGENVYDIHVEHKHELVEYESQYMSTEPIDTFILRLQIDFNRMMYLLVL